MASDQITVFGIMNDDCGVGVDDDVDDYDEDL